MNSNASLTLTALTGEASERTSHIDIKVMPKVLARLTRLALHYPHRSAAAVLCALGASVFNLVTPRLLGQAFDQAHHLLVAGRVAPSGAHAALLSPALLIIGASSGDLTARGMLDLEGVRGFLESGVRRAITLVLLLGVSSWRVLHADLTLGQRQLLSFARALLAKPKILILDEATANIDSFTEHAIQQALKVLLKGRTGRIVEQGNHHELLARRRLYHQLHSCNRTSFDPLAPQEASVAS